MKTFFLILLSLVNAVVAIIFTAVLVFIFYEYAPSEFLKSKDKNIVLFLACGPGFISIYGVMMINKMLINILNKTEDIPSLEGIPEYYFLSYVFFVVILIALSIIICMLVQDAHKFAIAVLAFALSVGAFVGLAVASA